VPIISVVGNFVVVGILMGHEKNIKQQLNIPG